MLIQILGTGCPKCNKMLEVAETAVNQMGVECELEKVTDITKMLKLGVMTTPALLVDGKLRCSGRVPSVEEVKNYLKGSST